VANYRLRQRPDDGPADWPRTFVCCNVALTVPSRPCARRTQTRRCGGQQSQGQSACRRCWAASSATGAVPQRLNPNTSACKTPRPELPATTGHRPHQNLEAGVDTSAPHHQPLVECSLDLTRDRPVFASDQFARVRARRHLGDAHIQHPQPTDSDDGTPLPSFNASGPALWHLAARLAGMAGAAGWPAAQENPGERQRPMQAMRTRQAQKLGLDDANARCFQNGWQPSSARAGRWTRHRLWFWPTGCRAALPEMASA